MKEPAWYNRILMPLAETAFMAWLANHGPSPTFFFIKYTIILNYIAVGGIQVEHAGYENFPLAYNPLVILMR